MTNNRERLARDIVQKYRLEGKDRTTFMALALVHEINPEDRSGEDRKRLRNAEAVSSPLVAQALEEFGRQLPLPDSADLENPFEEISSAE